MSQDSVVLNVPIWNKGRLQGGDDLWEEKFQSGSKNFGDNFVKDVTQADRPILVSGLRATKLGNESNKGVILISWKGMINEKASYAQHHISFDDTPILFVE